MITDGTIDGAGVWRQLLRPARYAAPRPALFLDRDGTIVEEIGHLRRAEDVRLIAGAAAAIVAAERAGIHVVIVSNQSGIGRGLFGWEEFAAVQRRMLAMLAVQGTCVDAVLACPHHPLAAPPWRHADHPARKPNPGMLFAAAELLPIALGSSWIVGDRANDLAAGHTAGLAGGLHVSTGYGSDCGERAAALAVADGNAFCVLTAASLARAPALLPLFAGADLRGSDEAENDQARP